MPNSFVASSCVHIKIPCYTYGHICALQSIDVDIPCGQLTALIGPNGGGKSTFMKILAGIYQADQGQIDIPRTTLSDLAYLPQSTTIDRSFPLQVQDVVAMGLWSKTGMFRKLPPALKPCIHEILAQVGLSGFEKRPLMALSGGQFQRLLFARLIAQDARILLLDEPFAAIDPATTEDLILLIQSWQNQGKTVLVVLHDLNIVKKYFPHALLLARQVIAYGPTEAVLSTENLAKAAFYV